MKLTQHDTNLLQFCQQEFSVTTTDIQLVLRHHQQTVTSIPMLLWQFGIVSIEQLNQIFHWLETQPDESELSELLTAASMVEKACISTSASVSLK